MRFNSMIGIPVALVALGGCVKPVLIGDYAVRPEMVEYGGIQESEVFIGRCERAPETGELRHCRRLQITFEE